MDELWANRATSSEAAVTQRHLKRLWGLPGTQLGVVAWPAVRRDRLFGTWHYWWQAHLLDCLVDAQLRDPQPKRRAETMWPRCAFEAWPFAQGLSCHGGA